MVADRATLADGYWTFIQGGNYLLHFRPIFRNKKLSNIYKDVILIY